LVITKKILFLLILFITLSIHTGATHLMGGSFTYEYIGKVGTNYQYKLKIKNLDKNIDTKGLLVKLGKNLVILFSIFNNIFLSEWLLER